MRKESTSKFNSYLISLIFAFSTMALFVIFTILVKTIDVQEGPYGKVGFYNFNINFLIKAGKHTDLYQISEILGYLALATCLIFVFLGVIQLVKRKSLRKIDKNIYHVALFYAVVLFVYFVFEKVDINNRPIYTLNEIEPSYPSSHTLFSICLLLVNATELKNYIKNELIYKFVCCAFVLLAVLIVGLRTICGVHWATDIIGGIILSSALIAFFEASKYLVLDTKSQKATFYIIYSSLVVLALILVGVIVLVGLSSLQSWLKAILIISIFIAILVIFLISLKYEQSVGSYECKKCKFQHKPTYKQVLSSMHNGTTRYLKCPTCKKRTWNKKIIK